MSNVAVIYGDISPNVVDGSSIWLSSITEVLAGIFDEVHLQLKMPAQNERIIGHLRSIPNIVIRTPEVGESGALSTDEAAILVETLVEKVDANAVIVRGYEACNSFCRRPRISKLLWSYVTDLPFPPDRLSKNTINRLNRIALPSHRLFSQTEASRAYLESIAPGAAGKTSLLNPMIPAEAFKYQENSRDSVLDRPLNLIYAGKFAKDWKTLEMLDLPRALNDRGIPATLTVVGDKFNRDVDDPSWIVNMKEQLQIANDDPASGVTWLGGITRAESIKEMKRADIGIGWRTTKLDSTLEISTKALEYSAAGAVPLINRNEDHLGLFGHDYPLFTTGADDATTAADIVIDALPRLAEAQNRVRSVVERFSMKQSQERLREVFSRAGCLNSPAHQAHQDKKNLLIVSHDLKFMGEILPALEKDPRFNVDQDIWDSLHNHDEDRSRTKAAWADVIFCEFAGPSVAWYSRQKKADSQLVTRLHGFEARSRAPWLFNIDHEQVDAWITVSDFYKQVVLDLLPVDPSRVHTIPNTVDLADFDRPKLSAARFHIGMVGMVPFLKRPDRAVELLQRLLEEDDRYILHIKGRMPWEYPHEWDKSVQKQLYLEFFRAIADDSKLRDRVVFDHFSSDIANWHRGIGFILSPSDVESFHLAPAEGMAARTIPIFWERDGVREIFGDDFLFSELSHAVEFILEHRDAELFARTGESARLAAQRWDTTEVYREWVHLLDRHQ